MYLEALPQSSSSSSLLTYFLDRLLRLPFSVLGGRPPRLPLGRDSCSDSSSSSAKQNLLRKSTAKTKLEQQIVW